MYTPDDQKAKKDEAAEIRQLQQIRAALSQDDVAHIIKEAAELKKHQEQLQDHTVLPTLSLNDIPKQITFTDSEVKMVGKVKVHYFDQPTNGISYVRLKCNLKNMPEELRLFVPMFSEFLSSIGTRNYRYDDFNNRLMSCTDGIKV